MTKCIRSLSSQAGVLFFIVKFQWRFKYCHTFLQNTEGKRVGHETKRVRDLYIPGWRTPIMNTWLRQCHGVYIQEAQLSQRDRATHYISWNLGNCCTTVRIKRAKLTTTILHQWIGERFCLFILDYCTVFATLYTYQALLAEMCRIGDFKGVGHFEAKF